MAPPVMHPPQRPARPRRTRAESARARGLEPEVTARPRPFADELGLAPVDDSALALSPEDLGSHFLSEAIVQGDLAAHDAAAFEANLAEDFDLDEPPDPAAELAIWSHLIERAAHGGRDTAPLREAVRAGTVALADARAGARKREHAPGNAVRVTDSSIREGSLLDREAAELDATVSPELQVEDGGRHARAGSAAPAPAPKSLSAAPNRKPRATKLARAHKLTRTAHSKLKTAAGKLKGLTNQLAHKARTTRKTKAKPH